MQSAADIAGEMDAGLASLFQGGLELALQIQADAMTAESPEARARLALAFHRLSRSVRQTAALRLKLAREAEGCRREDAAEVVRLDKVRLARRKAQVKAAVESLIWTETEGEEDDDGLKAELEDLLDIEVQDEETFLNEPLEVQVARICEALGLPSPSRPAQGGDEDSAPRPPNDDRLPDDDWRSSA